MPLIDIAGFKGNIRRRGDLPRHERLSGIDNRSSTPSCTTGSTDQMADMKYSLVQYKRIRNYIKHFKLQESTRKSYKKTWDRFNKFISKFDTIPPNWEDRIIVWATHLADNRRKSNTIKSYISVVRYCLSLDGIKISHQNCELAAIIQAAKHLNNQLYIRLPIQKDLLRLILRFIGSHYGVGKGQKCQELWLKAIFSMAYHGMMRISELTEGPHNLKAKDVIYGCNKSKITLYLRSSKTHTTADLPQIIIIRSEPKWGHLCPVKLITQYANARGRNSKDEFEPFFIHQDGRAITPQQYRTNLKYILFTLGLPSELYGSHSFRSGKATDQKLAGKSVSSIKSEGRWTTTTVYKYIRTSRIRKVSKIN